MNTVKLNKKPETNVQPPVTLGSIWKNPQGELYIIGNQRGVNETYGKVAIRLSSGESYNCFSVDDADAVAGLEFVADKAYIMVTV
jgi:hypothetical protein